jgi:hypothetical protein
MIDEALAEIDRVEADIEELMIRVAGPDVADRLRDERLRQAGRVAGTFDKATKDSVKR